MHHNNIFRNDYVIGRRQFFFSSISHLLLSHFVPHPLVSYLLLSYHTMFLSYHISYLLQDSPKGLCGSSKMPVAPVTIATREGQESVSLSLFPVRNQTDFLSQGIALVCLNYRTPMYVQCLSVLVFYLSKV
jgi:hypothetical protein